MKMYVANCTKQVQDFIYTVPENHDANGRPKQLRVQIQIGSQAVLPGVDNAQAVQGVADQHAMYGMVRADEVDRTRAFVGLCYSVDRPVSPERMMSAVEHNDDVLTERGRVIREEAAVAMNHGMEDLVDPRQGRLRATEFEITENEDRQGKRELGMGKQHVRVDRNAEPASPGPGLARVAAAAGRAKGGRAKRSA